jgi:hypothetical protein
VNLKFVFSFLLIALCLSSCKKHNDNVFLANETTQGFDGYSFTDSFRLLTSTVREDSIKSDSFSHDLIGAINDPVFGTYKASSFFQFKLEQLSKVISAQKLDSAVLIMEYTSSTAHYGDLNSDISLNIMELNEPMDKVRTHSNQTYSYNPTPIGTFSGKFRPSDSISIRELGKRVKIAPAITIKLSDAFASKIHGAGSGDLASQEAFINLFKGLAIIPTSSPSSGSGAITAINMRGSFARIRVYYADTLQIDLKVQADSRRLTHYDIQNQGADIIKQKKASSRSSFDTTYAQAMSGAKTKIQIPYLFGIIPKDGKKISVGKAELIIRPLAGTFASPFTLPTRMLILQPDPTTNLNAGVLDLLEPFYGGSYNSVKNEYRFNITRHIQGLFSDYQLKGVNNNRGLFLTIPTDYPIAPSRIVLDMRKKIPDAGIEFKLIYTEL